MSQLDTKYTCPTCGHSFTHKAGTLMIAAVPIHCGVIMTSTKEQPQSLTSSKQYTAEEVTRLAYVAFVADRSSQTPIEFERWQSLSPEEQLRYIEIAKAVVKEYQFQRQGEETEA